MKTKLPYIKDYHLYDFAKLLKVIDKSIFIIENNIKKIKIGSNKKPDSFKEDVSFFRKYWIDLKKPTQLSGKQLSSVLIYLLESNEDFEKLIKTDLFPKLLAQIKMSEKISAKKRLIWFYFKYYFLLERYNVDVTSNIRQMLKTYKGKNPLMKIYKKYLNEIFRPRLLLEKFQTVEKAQDMLAISAEYDYYKRILILDLTNKLNKLKPDDEEMQNIFDKIRSYKDFYYDKNILVKEYVVGKLIDKMMQLPNYEYSKWIDFIFELIGDPRATSLFDVHWSRVDSINKEYKKFLIQYLSKEDLNLFLEVLSDPEYDDIYRYRKTFWKPFAKYLVFVKLFINKQELRRLNDSFKKRFKDKSNYSYSYIRDYNRSFIYMDFGKIKVIEGTHNAKVRIYEDIPIPLKKKSYSYQDFYKEERAQRFLIDEIVHTNSRKGNWQEKVYYILRRNISNMDINLRETLLLE